MQKKITLLLAALVIIGLKGISQISRIIKSPNRNYIEYNGFPYLNYGIQGRIDDYIGSWPCGIAYKSTIYQYFEKTSEAGFRDLLVPVSWSWLETADNVFDFSYVDTLVQNANRYNLRLQLLWFGSDVCGYSDAPDYILNNHSSYPLISTTVQWAPLDLSNSNLIAKETRAVAALMAHLATYDVNHRVMMFQIENEPDGSGVMSQLWAGNQKSAVLNLMNKIGQTVHSSQANMVTRVNLTGWAAAKDTSDYKGLDGIDIVGRDMYQDNLSIFLSGSGYLNCSWNVNHTPENGALYSNNINLVCAAFQTGSGYLNYELRTTGSRTSQYDLGLYRSTTGNDWVERDGTLNVGYIYCNNPTPRAEVVGSEVTAFNQLIYKADKKIALCSALKRITAFNVSNSMGAINETKKFSTYTVTYSSPIGGEALALEDTNGDIIILSLKDNSTFTFQSLPSNFRISIGYFDDMNIWHQNSSRNIIGNNVTLNAKEVALLTSTAYSNETIVPKVYESIPINIYPNPNQGQFNINLASLDFNPKFMEVFSMDSKLVYSQNLTGEECSYNIQGIKNGIYLLKISGINTVRKNTTKLVITN